MTYQVKQGQPISMIQENSRVEEILQNVATILSTPKGSVPLDREFGVDVSFLDRPVQVAKVMMLSAVTEAIEEFEPRAKVERVTVAIDETEPGRLIPTVEVSIP